jgi:hypothetical protein
MTTFHALRHEVDQMEIVHGNLAARLDYILDSARISADELFASSSDVEKAAPVEAFDHIALGSVAEILRHSDDAEACAWFAARGVKW